MKTDLTELEKYKTQWGAKKVPFGEESEGLYQSAQIQRALRRLSRTANLGSTMLLYGASGTGKSKLLQWWITQLKESKKHETLTVTQSTLSGSGILGDLLEKTGETSSLQRSKNLKKWADSLQKMQPKRIVVILDEVQFYDSSALEEVRLLQGLGLDAANRFGLILSGEEHFLKQLRLQANRALLNRISSKIELRKMTISESKEYLSEHEKEAGLNDIFEESAAQLLIEACEGNGRLLKNGGQLACLQGKEENKITSSSISYLLKKLKMHEIIEKEEGKNQYKLTKEGRHVVNYVVRAERILKEGMGGLLSEELPEEKDVQKLRKAERAFMKASEEYFRKRQVAA